MFAIRIENKKESLMYTIALGGVLCLIIGVTWIYWTHSAHRTLENVTLTEKTASERYASSVKQHETESNGNSSLWFFGTLIVLLLLLFGLTFRYYSHREMKEAEKRWRTACERFLTRMEIEQATYKDERKNGDSVWSRILKGESVEETEIIRISDRKQRDAQLV